MSAGESGGGGDGGGEVEEGFCSGGMVSSCCAGLVGLVLRWWRGVEAEVVRFDLAWFGSI